MTFLFSEDPKWDRTDKAHLRYYASAYNQPTTTRPIYQFNKMSCANVVGWFMDWLGDLMFFPANLLASTEETKANITKENMHPKQKYTITYTKIKARFSHLL